MTTYAGHGEKSLTVENMPSGVRFLRIEEGTLTVIVTLTPDESETLADALTERTPRNAKPVITEITRY